MRLGIGISPGVLALVLLSGCCSTPAYAPRNAPTRSPRIQAVRHWSELDNLIQSSQQPLAVVFQLPTCPHCRALKKKLPVLAGEYPGIRFVTVDGARLPYPPYQHGVKGYPTTVLFSGGQEVDRFGGNRFMFLLRKRFDNVVSKRW